MFKVSDILLPTKHYENMEFRAVNPANEDEDFLIGFGCWDGETFNPPVATINSDTILNNYHYWLDSDDNDNIICWVSLI